jgi:hypothetical protein
MEGQFYFHPACASIHYRMHSRQQDHRRGQKRWVMLPSRVPHFSQSAATGYAPPRHLCMREVNAALAFPYVFLHISRKVLGEF